MVLLARNSDADEAMSQIVPSAGFTPPCDYNSFAETFDLSLLPSVEQPVSPSTLFYTSTPPPPHEEKNPKIYTTYYPNSPELDNNDSTLEFGPDFQKLLDIEKSTSFTPTPISNIYLDVPSNNFQPLSPTGSTSSYSHQSAVSPNDQFRNYRQSLDANFYPSSPENSLYTSPNSAYSRSPCEEYLHPQYIKQEGPVSTSPLLSFSPLQIKEENLVIPNSLSSPTSPATSYSSLSSPEQINNSQTESTDVFELLETTALDKQIKQESTVDFGSLLNGFQGNSNLRALLSNNVNKSDSENQSAQPKDHQLLREVLRDTSFQRKFNIRPIDFGFMGRVMKMEEPDENASPSELIKTCNEQIDRETIEPVLNLAIEQMRKDVNTTCAALSISPDPQQWNANNVFSWVHWTAREFGLQEPTPDQWNIPGSALVDLSEEDFVRRSPQGGAILYAQLEIWKAAYSEENLSMHWLPETNSSNTSSGDVSDDDEEESSTQTDTAKPSTSRTGSHIHLWQFLKELLASPQVHGSCIRWLDRSKGIFKIEDSVKVARLWGKRKNRPAMNYDKLSRSIRQYYKKGIMKKTERSQRLVYQFCHPYCL